MILRSRLCLFIKFFIHSMRELRGGWGSPCLSFSVSVQIRLWFVTFFCFDIGIPSLRRETMCRVLSWSRYDVDLWPQSQSYIVFFYLSSCPTRARNLCLLKHWHTIFGTLVYHNKLMCRVYSWSWYDIDLCPQGQINRDFDMASCSGLSFFVLCHTIFGKWVYNHGTMCHIHSWPLYDLDIWPQYQNYVSFLNVCLGKIVFALWHWYTKFGKWMYHHATTCCLHSWPRYDLDIWSIYAVEGGIFNEFCSQFLILCLK